MVEEAEAIARVLIWANITNQIHQSSRW